MIFLGGKGEKGKRGKGYFNLYVLIPFAFSPFRLFALPANEGAGS